MENGISNLSASLPFVLKSESGEEAATKPKETSKAKIPATLEDTVNISKEALLEAARAKITKTVDQNGSETVAVDGKDIDGQAAKAQVDQFKFGQSFAKPATDVVDLTGDEGQIKSRGGNDLTIVDGDHNTIEAGDGNDDVFVTGSSNNINLGNGNDQLRIVGDNNTVSESNDNDNVIINGDSNVLRTGRGNDSVIAAASDSLILTGNGDDTLELSGENNTISTGIGNDQLKVTGDANNIFTGAGDDNIEAAGNENLVLTGAGNDNINISGSNNAVFAGSGDDTITIKNASTNPVVDIEDTGTSTEDNDVVSATNIIAQSTNNSFTEIHAGSGDDTINLEQTEGAFNIEGGSGANTLNLSNLSLGDISASISGNTLSISQGDSLELNIRDIGSITLSDGQAYTAEELVSAVNSYTPVSEPEDIDLPAEEEVIEEAQNINTNKAIERLTSTESSGKELDIVG